MSRFLSFVIPLHNEASTLASLCSEIRDETEKLGLPYEIILVNDGSNDSSQFEIEFLHKEDPKHIIGIELAGHLGKAAALDAGFRIAKGSIVFTLDADLQDQPKEIGKFLEKIDKGFDVVSGWKQNRKDGALKNTTSKFYNAVTGSLSKAKLHDFNCGFKAYRKEVVKSISLYGQLHRFIPVIAESKGYKVGEVRIEHRKRVSGKSKYGPSRFAHGLIDFLTIFFITRFRTRPLHFSALFSIPLMIIGLIWAVVELFMLPKFNGNDIVHFIIPALLILFSMLFIMIGLASELLTSYMLQDYRSVKSVLKKDEGLLQ